VGNPPFVTARNPKKRELWRQRWPRVCVGTYQLVCPFFELGFGLLRAGSQLGFIVSNAFAKRRFGKPLVQDFFPTIELQKIVDCSGLMFPGHGTPTCLIFGRAAKPNRDCPIRVVGILSGGGDLRTPPEESPLWHILAAEHDHPGYLDSRVVVADIPRAELEKWPLNLDASTKSTLEALEASSRSLSDYIQSYGSMFDTHKDDVFMVSADCTRRYRIEQDSLVPVVVGDEIRDWQLLSRNFVLRPYDTKWKLRKEDKSSHLFGYLRLFRHELGGQPLERGLTIKQENRGIATIKCLWKRSSHLFRWRILRLGRIYISRSTRWDSYLHKRPRSSNRKAITRTTFLSYLLSSTLPRHCFG